jgi:hypothetical protein
VLISRAVFLVLFVYFVRTPRDLLSIVGLFVSLCLGDRVQRIVGSHHRRRSARPSAYAPAAWKCSSRAPRTEPIGLISTLALVFVWSLARHSNRSVAGRDVGHHLLLVLTVFSASRGGLIGLVFSPA